jgi:hypothetical protein
MMVMLLVFSSRPFTGHVVFGRSEHNIGLALSYIKRVLLLQISHLLLELDVALIKLCTLKLESVRAGHVPVLKKQDMKFPRYQLTVDTIQLCRPNPRIGLWSLAK